MHHQLNSHISQSIQGRKMNREVLNNTRQQIVSFLAWLFKAQLEKDKKVLPVLKERSISTPLSTYHEVGDKEVLDSS
ncbi:hypothetical protein H4Q26_014360 [Puccinia striiformis f. sp. tritici PST-130]|nr:hypothetical protein H4Q26_014360 [Puccinia striiformis f. sp. tritici PST-130]